MLLIEANLDSKRWPHRSVRPRTQDCQSCNMGSNPIGAAILMLTVAQLVELQIVVLVVVSSILICQPIQKGNYEI